MLSHETPSFKFACQRTNKKKNKKEKRKERTRGEERGRERRRGFHRFEGKPPCEKVNEKKGGEKEEQGSEARPNPMKTFRVIVNSSTRQSTP